MNQYLERSKQAHQLYNQQNFLDKIAEYLLVDDSFEPNGEAKIHVKDSKQQISYCSSKFLDAHEDEKSKGDEHNFE